MSNVLLMKRRNSGAAGAPSSLKSGELAWNNVDKKFYFGVGDDGSGNATSIVEVAGEGSVVMLAAVNQTIAGTKTFSSFPKTPSSAPSADYDAANKKYVDDSVSSAGGGDMLKATYDTDNDGKVDAAEVADTAPWAGITDKPTVFPAEAHAHDAEDIDSGVFDAARIPNLDAAKITTGTIDIARIPIIPSQVQVVSAGGIAALDSGQQAQIGAGTVVTTTDGRRWVYSGSGSKTAEASYVELADVTPDWSAIANKPSFHAVATSGDYDDLSGKPSLGTMAAQNANVVDIDGGSIDGVTLDGGTF
jgi:hypothetical protein